MYDLFDDLRTALSRRVYKRVSATVPPTNFNKSKALAAPFLLAALIDGSAAYAAGPAPVNLGNAGAFVILSKSGITDVPSTHVYGNVGTSPITGAADLLTCTEVRGTILSVDAAGPAPCSIPNPAGLTLAVNDMQAAYTDAAGRKPTVTGLGGGNIGGRTLAPGVYKWTTAVTIPTSVTLAGGSGDVWIFQIAQGLDLAATKSVLLRGGALAKNVFWQVGGAVTIGTTAHFKGVILSKTGIAVKTGAILVGRLYAQTAVTLQMDVIFAPPR